MAASTSEQVLAQVQQRGQEALVRLGLPTRKHEAWRLTNLGRLEAVARMPIRRGSHAADRHPSHSFQSAQIGESPGFMLPRRQAKAN